MRKCGTSLEPSRRTACLSELLRKMNQTEIAWQSPDAKSPRLCLTNPTGIEQQEVDRLDHAAWGNWLPVTEYLQECNYLAVTPMDRMSWILTTSDQLPNQRPILASCEIYCQRSYLSDATTGQLSQGFCYAINSVFVMDTYRGQGYASRLMKELAELIPTWQPAGNLGTVTSTLYSDVGEFYAKFGWQQTTNNEYLEFEPTTEEHTNVFYIKAEHLAGLCYEDEAITRTLMMRQPAQTDKLFIVPSVEQILWHINKEKFACERLFQGPPLAKGALAGQMGGRIWAIFSRRFYNHRKNDEEKLNSLYILLLVIENQNPTPDHIPEQARCLKEVLRAAQAEAAAWQLHRVKLWHPTALVRQLLKYAGVENRLVRRTTGNVACLKRFGSKADAVHETEWVTSVQSVWNIIQP